MHRTRRRTVAAGTVAAVVTVLAAVAGCTAPAARPAPPATVSPSAASASAVSRSAGGRSGSPAALTAAGGRSAAGAAAACDPAASSLAPSGPPQVTSGSFMATIKARGYLIAGVDQSTYHFGYLNPLDGQIEGFDIDMVRAVAKAIFGDPDKVQYKAITDAERVPDVAQGHVDIVAHTMTITCDRLKQIDFSSVYYEAHQKVLVPDNSAAAGLAELGGKKVCATQGSDSVGTIKDSPSHPAVVQVPYWTDCLVMLQQNEVAAVSTDDSILYGLAAQDPFTKVVGPALTNEPYGLAISRQHPDFVRFVNAVLAANESDGGWAASYKRWLGTPVATPPAPRYAR
jgi:polar amino acid transport system substrate-binding protein